MAARSPECDLEVLLPHLGSLVIETVTDCGAGVVVDARLRVDESACPRCGQPSRRVHSRYRRRLVDAPIAGRPVQLRLRVRRFFCDNAACATRTFAEQPATLTAPRGTTHVVAATNAVHDRGGAGRARRRPARGPAGHADQSRQPIAPAPGSS